MGNYSCCNRKKYSELKLNLEDTSIYKTLSKYSKSKKFIKVPFNEGLILQITRNTSDKKESKEDDLPMKSVEDRALPDLEGGNPKKYCYMICHNNRAKEPRYMLKFHKLTNKKLLLFYYTDGFSRDVIEIEDTSDYTIKNGEKIYEETFDIRLSIWYYDCDSRAANKLYHVFRKE